MKYSSKITKFRTFALCLIFAGILIMYIGLLFKSRAVLMTIFMFAGFLAIILSCVIYFLVGMLSTKAVQVVCPSCNKITKMLGRVDICMFCRQPLTLDKELEGKAFDEKYNRKKNNASE